MHIKCGDYYGTRKKRLGYWNIFHNNQLTYWQKPIIPVVNSNNSVLLSHGPKRLSSEKHVMFLEWNKKIKSLLIRFPLTQEFWIKGDLNITTKGDQTIFNMVLLTKPTENNWSRINFHEIWPIKVFLLSLPRD